MFSKFKNVSIGFKLVLSYAVIFLVSVIFGITSWYYTRSSLNERIGSELENMATTVRDMIGIAADVSIRNNLRSVTEKNRDIVAHFYRRTLSVGQNDFLTEENAKKMVSEIMLSQTIGTSGYMFALDIRNAPKSIPMTVHPQIQGTDLAHVDFIRKAVKLKTGYLEYEWKNPNETAPRKKAMYVVHFEPWQWIIGAASYVEEFSELVEVNDFSEKIRSITIGEKGYVYVLDADGNILIHPELENVNFREQTDAEGRKFIQEIIDMKNGRIEYVWKNPDESVARKKLAFFKSTQRFNWIVVSSAYRDEIYSSMKTLNILSFMMILTIFIITLIIVFMINARIVKPLKKASSAAEQLGKLDLTVDMKTILKDEVGRLFRSMNEMINSLRETVSAASESANRVNSAAEVILSAVNEQAVVATEQSASISEISSTMEEFSATSAQIADNSNQVVSVADTTVKKLEIGSELVSLAMRNMDKIGTDNQGNIKEIHSLKKKIDEINKVMGIINNIADQTKLIAFNAAIESSSAGEAGKRFGVVAVEIRRLADNVMESTGEIETRINEIQAAASNMVIASEASSKGVAAGIDSFSKIEELFGGILESGKTTTDAAKQISMSTRQQKTATVQVVEALKDIARGSRQTSEAVADISSASKGLKDQAGNLTLLMEKFIITKADEKI